MHTAMRTLCVLSVLSVLIPLSCAPSGHVQQPSGPAATSRPASVDSDKLPGTIITADLGQVIAPGKNVIWCSTFQLAWQELEKFSGGPVVLDPPCDLANRLNAASVSAKDTPDGTVSDAGVIGEGVIERIRAKLKKNFGDKADTPLLNEIVRNSPANAVIAYAYMLKEMQFAQPFEKLEPRAFRLADSEADGPNGDKKQVAFFGIDKSTGELLKKRMRQVRVLWHRFVFDAKDEHSTGQEFIIELLNTSNEDRIILARIPVSHTLGETAAVAMKRVGSPNTKVLQELPESLPANPTEEQMAAFTPEEFSKVMALKWEEGSYADNLRKHNELLRGFSRYACLTLDEDLAVPSVDLHTLKSYGDLVGKTVRSKNPRLDGKPIAEARQRIRFALNENGAVLESEAGSSVFGTMSPRHFVFDQPFLILLVRKGADKPYFAFWVGNDELLVRAESATTEPEAQ